VIDVVREFSDKDYEFSVGKSIISQWTGWNEDDAERIITRLSRHVAGK